MADMLSRSHPWTQRIDPRAALRTAVVWDGLDPLVAALAAKRPELRIVDVGGGTGGFSVPLAMLGHRVTVVDPSPDALAALGRRAVEAGVETRITRVQGDAGSLVALLGPAGAEVVLCHGALEYVDDPQRAVRDALEVLSPGGILSLLVHQRLGAVLARAMAGRFTEASRLLDDPMGHAGGSDPVPRRFDEATLRGYLDGTGARVVLTHGVRLFTDLLPGALVDAELGGAQALLDLERRASDHPDHPCLSALAAQLHLVAEVSGT